MSNIVTRHLLMYLDQITDLEKALCFLDGRQYHKILSIRKVYEKEANFGVWRHSEFFRTKLFKKGTMHFDWLDKGLRDRFNATAAHYRPEVPEKTKKGRYE